MDRFLPDERMDPAVALLQVLTHNGIPYRGEKDGLRFALSDTGRRWEIVCRYAPQTVVIYGIYPFPVDDRAKALEKLNKASASLTRGGIFLSDTHVVVRVSADLFDAYSAQESITRALEYSAGVMTHYWGLFGECAH